MLVSCEVAGVKTNCSYLFTRVPTDSGMCCAINWKNALRTSEYKRLVESMQNSTANSSVLSQSGEKSGLRLILDLHSNRVSFGTLDQDFNAFKVFIGQPAEFPVVKQRSLKLQPGREHFVELKAEVVIFHIHSLISSQVVSSNKDIRRIAPDARSCYFEDEMDLTFYEKYTFINCQLECAISEVNKTLGCTPWHLPKVTM